MSKPTLESILLPLKAESLLCIHRFMKYRRKEPRRYPKSRCAAVAIILFVGRLGDLYVLLSTRSGKLRSYANDTALPGGKYDEGDGDEEGTARREAYEEIGLPMDRDLVRCLCLFEPFLTGNSLIVTPVVLLVTDNAIQPQLNADEVTNLFSMPLSSFLCSRPTQIPGWFYGISERIPQDPTWFLGVGPPPKVQYSYTNEEEEEVGWREGKYYGWRDVSWGEGRVRMHRFLTGREGGGIRPVYGLTSAVLIHAARIGYDQQPDFEITAPGQKSMEERIDWEMRSGLLRIAAEREGLAKL